MIRNRCTVYLRIATQYVHNKMIKSIDILKSGKLNYDDYTMMHLYIYIYHHSMSSGGYNATSRNIPAGQWKKSLQWKIWPKICRCFFLHLDIINHYIYILLIIICI